MTGASDTELSVELRRRRQARGLSQREMARLIGLSAHSAIADYESGRRVPHRDVVDAYERAFGVTDGSLQQVRFDHFERLANQRLGEQRAISGKRRTAERVAGILMAHLSDVEAICLYGSVARGDDESTSDIDLLVLGSEAVSLQDALAALPEDIPCEVLSINCCTRAQLEELFQHNPSFAVHVIVEGVVLGDRTGFLDGMLSRPVREITADDLRRATRRLDQFDDLTRFSDDFLCCLSDLYMTGRLVITLSLLKDHFPIFECRHAFATWRQLHPAHADEVTVIEQLAPYYLLVRQGGAQPLPFAPHGSSREVTRAVAALRSIAAA